MPLASEAEAREARTGARTWAQKPTETPKWLLPQPNLRTAFLAGPSALWAELPGVRRVRPVPPPCPSTGSVKPARKSGSTEAGASLGPHGGGGGSAGPSTWCRLAARGAWKGTSSTDKGPWAVKSLQDLSRRAIPPNAPTGASLEGRGWGTHQEEAMPPGLAESPGHRGPQPWSRAPSARSGHLSGQRDTGHLARRRRVYVSTGAGELCVGRRSPGSGQGGQQAADRRTWSPRQPAPCGEDNSGSRCSQQAQAGWMPPHLSQHALRPRLIPCV